jgi:hypothetical protein
LDHFGPGFGTPATPLRVASAGVNPSTTRVPASGLSCPRQSLRIVDLPQPDGPISAVNEPGASFGLGPSHTTIGSAIRLLAVTYAALAGKSAEQRSEIITGIHEEFGDHRD